jgi:hypothetical protein
MVGSTKIRAISCFVFLFFCFFFFGFLETRGKMQIYLNLGAHYLMYVPVVLPIWLFYSFLHFFYTGLKVIGVVCCCWLEWDWFCCLWQLKDESASFDLLLKTKRGTKEEHVRSEVHRTGDGQWSVKHATVQW